MQRVGLAWDEWGPCKQALRLDDADFTFWGLVGTEGIYYIGFIHGVYFPIPYSPPLA